MRITLDVPDMTPDQALAAWELTEAFAAAIWRAWEPQLAHVLASAFDEDAVGHVDGPDADDIPF